jgi:hypothetical protein
MPVHSQLVERVDLGRLGGSAGGNDVLGDRFDRCPEASGEKEPGPLGGEGARDRAADRASGAVDHRNLVLQHHLWCLSVPGWSHLPTS